ncbi:MAG: (d)CMP kinase [Gammaproteobacteria bacterium]
MSTEACAPVDVPVLTLDGPSGAGKGTVARRVADQLGWHLLDSGALYRLVGLAAQRSATSVDDEAGLVALVASSDIEFESTMAGDERIVLNGDVVTDQIRTEQCGEWASQVAAVPAVRRALVAKQHGFAEPPGLVADGRDMGTVIFPDATLKVFLTATAHERAQRRHKQLKQKGIGGTFSALYEDIRRRDERDAQRSVAPLVAASDAFTVDTTSLNIDEVVAIILDAARKSKIL